MNTRIPRLVMLALPLVASCNSLTEPDLRGIKRSPDVPGISIRLEVIPNTVSSGDSVEFRAWARNFTNIRIQVGQACGPAMDAVFGSPEQATQSALVAKVGPHGAFTCELGPYHFAEAHDSLLVSIRIAAPAKGQYLAIAGARRGEGLSNLSGSVAFQVR